jgi:hypothetical protein
VDRATRLIAVLSTSPVLTLFDPKLHTELHTDASHIGYGAVLLQKHNDQLNPVAYFSRLTQGYESKYHSYELETLAVVSAVKHFRHYLLGVKFVLVTDCNALKGTFAKKDLNPCMVVDLSPGFSVRNYISKGGKYVPC